MITHSSKKIYIIGSNPDDFFDLTVEAVNIFSQSDIIIFSKKFNTQYKVFFKKNNKKVFLEEDLADSKIKLLKVIHKLFEKYNSISYLKVGDTFLFFENHEELFFKKKIFRSKRFLEFPK